MTLNIKISNRGMKLGKDLEKFVNKKTIKLDRYIHGIQDVRVDLSHNISARDANDRFKAQITVVGNRFVLRAEERSADIHSAFDSALAKMQNRISKYKGKRFDRKTESASDDENAIEAIEASYEDQTNPEIVKRKLFLLNPMDENEALEQMKILDHEDFFLFFNIETNAMNVLYKRRDGDFGLIEGQLA